MARAGILYSQVSNAAARLAATGTNPTVDSVRAALGDTGSKGTIAPMLRQWKAQHQGESAAAGVGLPVDLLEAVKGVYQRLEAGAEAKVDQLREAHDKARQVGLQELEVARSIARQLRAEQDLISTELAQVKATVAHERDERQHGAVAMAVVRAENDGLTQRLADRAAEVSLLIDQLKQARHQFNHFQEKTSDQRQSDRQSFEVRIGTLERDAQLLRTNLQEHQQAVAVLRVEKQGLQQQVDRAVVEAKQHLGEVQTLQGQLVSARETASREHMAAAMGAKLLGKAEEENARLGKRNNELVSEVAMLKAQLEAAAPSIRSLGIGKKK